MGVQSDLINKLGSNPALPLQGSHPQEGQIYFQRWPREGPHQCSGGGTQLEKDLKSCQGTIPVPYRGQNYNIPVSLYLLDTHPYHAPLCFVKPTPDMQVEEMVTKKSTQHGLVQVKVSKHVDAAGKIYLPYLHEWAHPASDLVKPKLTYLTPVHIHTQCPPYRLGSCRYAL